MQAIMSGRPEWAPTKATCWSIVLGGLALAAAALLLFVIDQRLERQDEQIRFLQSQQVEWEVVFSVSQQVLADYDRRLGSLERRMGGPM